MRWDILTARIGFVVLLAAVGFAVVASVLVLGRNHEALLLCSVS